VCDPAGAELRLFRRATAGERRWVQDVVEALRGAAYKTVKQLRADLDWAEGMGRDQFEEMLNAMLRAGLIAMESAEFEKDGKVIPYRRISLTDAGLEVRATTPLRLLISDGVVAEFGSAPTAPTHDPKPGRGAPKGPDGRAEKKAQPVVNLTPESQALAGRLREWRAAEAKRLGLPPYMVLQERTLAELAQVRPGNPNQLLMIDGIGPAKVEKFGAAILGLCRAGE
jgi:superfamily II DNA helicase RecQ